MSTIYTLNGKVLKNAANDKWLIKKEGDPYNPLGLPPFTIRCKFTGSFTPKMGDSQTIVDAGENVWDITKNSTNWSSLFSDGFLMEVLGANTTGVTNMSMLFFYSGFLSSISLFDTSSVTDMYRMFRNCSRLTSVPLFDTSSATNVAEMFNNTPNVQSGALALYQQMSTQANPPTYYYACFKNCGSDTVTGAAELAQIPSSWGGTGA